MSKSRRSIRRSNLLLKRQFVGNKGRRSIVRPFIIIRIVRRNLLFQQHHLDSLRSLRRLQSGEIDPGGEIGGIPNGRMPARLARPLEYGGHALAEEVVGENGDLGPS